MTPESKKRKNPNDYPRLTSRIPASMLRRMARVAQAADLSLGAIVVAGLSNHLPVLEHKYGLVQPKSEE